jgi:L-asparaginase/Glu-tRNA(Gln) amidotransferase subunit D
MSMRSILLVATGGTISSSRSPATSLPMENASYCPAGTNKELEKVCAAE